MSQPQKQQGRDNQNKGGSASNQNKGSNANKGGNNANKGGSNPNNKGGNTGNNKGGNTGNKGGNTGNTGNKGGNTGNTVNKQNKPKVDNTARNIRHVGVVRAVSSGDTVVVSKENSTDNITLTLLSLKAPLLGKKSKDEVTKDQPFAWESREFLRDLLIGKSVVYRIEHEFGNRTYGDIWLKEESVRPLIVSKGWAEVSVKEKKDKEGQPMEPRKEDQELLKLQETAKTKKVGIWATGGKHVRTVKYHENKKDTDPDALFAFFEKNKGKALNGVVEQVKTGSTLKIYVPSTSDEFTVNLSGVHCPVYRYNDESASEPFSREAKFFTEIHLLNRDVIVTLESMDKLNNFFGTVLDAVGKRNIVTNLIKIGLGSFVEWNAPSQHAKEWLDAEKEAKEQKLRIWKKWRPTDAKPTGNAGTNNSANTGAVKASEFLGTVVEVLNAGSVVVRVQKGDVGYNDVTVNLSSIKVPRLAPKEKEDKKKGQKGKQQTADKEADNEEPVKEVYKDPATMSEKERKAHQEKQQKLEEEKIQNAYAVQGREYLRKELIGKKVKVVYDYTSQPYQPPGTNKTLPGRPFYSVYVGGKTNVATQLVRKGLATVSSHQEGDARSADYKDLILAEKAAKTDGVGQHAPKSKAPIVHVNDLSSENESKCRPFLVALKRLTRAPAVVEYVFSGSRFKVYIPSQGLTVSFALQGVMGDRVVRNEKAAPKPGQSTDYRLLYPIQDQKGNPIPANEALHFSRDHLHQRDVEITIDDIDKNGTFFGTLVLNKVDYTQSLLEGGHARLHHNSAQKLSNYKQLNQIEEASKKQHKGVWWDWNEEEEELKRKEHKQKIDKEREERQAAKAKDRLLSLTVTEIMTGSTFFFQKATDETKELMENMMGDLQSRGWDSKPAHEPAKKGEWVAAKFSVDGNWYRAEVERIIVNKEKPDAPKEFELRYVDYGNTEVVTSKAIRKLDEDLGYSKFPAQARRGKLAYIRAPALDDEFGEDAAALFKEMVWGKTLLANIEFVDGEGSAAVYHISLGDEETSINGALVIQGLARVESRRQTRIVSKDVYTVLQKVEAKAQSSRLCIWQYGAIPDSDEERQWANMLK